MRLPVALVVSFGVVCGAIAVVALLGFPYSADEYAYLYQARTFLEGRLTNPPAPDPVACAPQHVISTNEGMLSKYPPGWPAALALGEALRAPWIVNPLLSVLVLFVGVRLATRIAGRTSALVWIILLGTNAFFLLNGASFFAHPLAALAILVFLDRGASFVETSRVRDSLAAGAVLGVLVLVRPLDAALVAFAGLLALCFSPRALLRSYPAALPLLLAAGAFLLYNQRTTGGFFAFGHTTLDAGDSLLANPFSMANAFRARLEEYALLALPGVLAPLALFVPKSDLRRKFVWMAVILCAVFWAGYSLYPAPDLPPRVGPRYLFPTHPILVLLSAIALSAALKPRYLWPLVALIACAQCVQTGIMASSLHVVLRESARIFEARDALAKAIAPERGIVLLAGGSGDLPSWDLVRNGVDLDDPVLLVRRDANLRRFGDRVAFTWEAVGGPPFLSNRDPSHPVGALILAGKDTIVVPNRPERGWILTAGRNDCADRIQEFPGSREPDWAWYGPCGDEVLVELSANPEAPPDTVLGRTQGFYLVYRSFFTVDEPGWYAFYLTSDDGSRFYVDGFILVDDDENHLPRPRSGSVYLERGSHPVALSYFNGRGESMLHWAARGPDGELIEASRFTTRPPERDDSGAARLLEEAPARR